MCSALLLNIIYHHHKKLNMSENCLSLCQILCKFVIILISGFFSFWYLKTKQNNCDTDFFQIMDRTNISNEVVYLSKDSLEMKRDQDWSLEVMFRSFTRDV